MLRILRNSIVLILCISVSGLFQSLLADDDRALPIAQGNGDVGEAATSEVAATIEIDDAADPTAVNRGIASARDVGMPLDAAQEGGLRTYLKLLVRRARDRVLGAIPHRVVKVTLSVIKAAVVYGALKTILMAVPGCTLEQAQPVALIMGGVAGVLTLMTNEILSPFLESAKSGTEKNLRWASIEYAFLTLLTLLSVGFGIQAPNSLEAIGTIVLTTILSYLKQGLPDVATQFFHTRAHGILARMKERGPLAPEEEARLVNIIEGKTRLAYFLSGTISTVLTTRVLELGLGVVLPNLIVIGLGVPYALYARYVRSCDEALQ